jgi:hypothetical protein
MPVEIGIEFAPHASHQPTINSIQLHPLPDDWRSEFDVDFFLDWGLYPPTHYAEFVS